MEKVVDTTGAGDLYAAGFLYGLTRGLPSRTAARLGSLCAAEIISHVGARPETALRDLVASAGLNPERSAGWADRDGSRRKLEFFCLPACLCLLADPGIRRGRPLA